MRQIRLSPLHAGRVGSGFPHVLREWLGARDPRSMPGEVVELVDARGQFLASAFAEADETIGYRIFSRKPEDELHGPRLERIVRSAAGRAREAASWKMPARLLGRC